MKRISTAVWNGPVQGGNGNISTQGGALKQTQYSFTSRFADGAGTNPEELLAAAHAGCYAMATAFALGGQGFKPEKVEVKATANLEQVNGWSVTGMHLEIRATVPGISLEQFKAIAAAAEKGCVISRVLSIPITLDAQLA